MGYDPGTFNQIMQISQYGTSANQNATPVTLSKFQNYYLVYTSLNTTSSYKIRIKGTTTQGYGYRIDTTDKRDIFTIGDIVEINSVKYSVKEIVTPAFTADSGKILSPQLISDNPIDVFPSTKRVYRFDISININEI